MTNILSSVKSALGRNKEDGLNDSLSPQSSQAQMSTLSSLSNNEKIRASQQESSINGNAISSNQGSLPFKQDPKRRLSSSYFSTSSSSLDLDLKNTTSTFDTNNGDEVKTKKQLKVEKKAVEDAELAELAAKARKRGEEMNLGPMYIPNEFKHRGLAMNIRDPF
ncbi:uncharacterized protein IL334_006827 [Kwoniella shivajii]|uniref:Uncharacterized protein n=1 Tax=Kwoniella shivajii TaxID=564305 RepID=A0ABZ1D707_9TREE|nr:hypothetical protein IL334_006827 [Kwoniella shivajii]